MVYLVGGFVNYWRLILALVFTLPVDLTIKRSSSVPT